MLLETKYFGQVECSREEALCFPRGLFGFEEEREFLLLPFEGSAGTLLCFQSTRTPALAFVAMDPFALPRSWRSWACPTARSWASMCCAW